LRYSLVGKSEGKRPDGRILECFVQKLGGGGDWRFGLESTGSGQEPVMSCCEYDNEPSGFIKGEEFLD
jgi:hypothetical protein